MRQITDLSNPQIMQSLEYIKDLRSKAEYERSDCIRQLLNEHGVKVSYHKSGKVEAKFYQRVLLVNGVYSPQSAFLRC